MNEFEPEIQTEFGISFEGAAIRSEGTIGQASDSVATSLADTSVGPQVIKGLLGDFGATKIFLYVGQKSVMFFNSTPRRGLAFSLPASGVTNLIKNCVSLGGVLKQRKSGFLVTF